MTVRAGVAFEAVSLQLAHDEGRMTHAELVEAFTEIVSDVQSQGDAFELLAHLAKLASGSLCAAAGSIDAAPADLLRVAALRHAQDHDRTGSEEAV